MMGILEQNGQRDLFRPMSKDLIDINQELILLTDKIDWTLRE